MRYSNDCIWEVPFKNRYLMDLLLPAIRDRTEWNAQGRRMVCFTLPGLAFRGMISLLSDTRFGNEPVKNYGGVLLHRHKPFLSKHTLSFWGEDECKVGFGESIRLAVGDHVKGS